MPISFLHCMVYLPCVYSAEALNIIGITTYAVISETEVNCAIDEYCFGVVNFEYSSHLLIEFHYTFFKTNHILKIVEECKT